MEELKSLYFSLSLRDERIYIFIWKIMWLIQMLGGKMEDKVGGWGRLGLLMTKSNSNTCVYIIYLLLLLKYTRSNNPPLVF